MQNYDLYTFCPNLTFLQISGITSPYLLLLELREDPEYPCFINTKYTAKSDNTVHKSPHTTEGIWVNLANWSASLTPEDPFPHNKKGSLNFIRIVSTNVS